MKSDQSIKVGVDAVIFFVMVIPVIFVASLFDSICVACKKILGKKI